MSKFNFQFNGSIQWIKTLHYKDTGERGREIDEVKGAFYFHCIYQEGFGRRVASATDYSQLCPTQTNTSLQFYNLTSLSTTKTAKCKNNVSNKNRDLCSGSFKLNLIPDMNMLERI